MTSSAAVCGFISSENVLSNFVNRWNWYVNEGVFATKSHPPQNFGLLLPVMSVLSLILHTLMYRFGSDWFSKKYSVTFKKKIFGDEKERREWNSRIVSNVHAIVSSLIALYCIVFVYLPSPDVGILMVSDRSCIFLIGYCVGYFLYDIFIVMSHYPHLGGMETVLHHSISVVALIGSAMWEKAIVLMVLMMFTEISTPFVNQRYFFSKCNMKDSKLYAYNGILMWLTFGIVRISFCFYIPNLVWHDSETWCSFPIGWIILVTLMISLICFLNIFWFYKITMGLVQVVFAKKQPSSSTALPSTSSTPCTPDRIESNLVSSTTLNNKMKKSDDEDEDNELYDEDDKEMEEKVATTLPLIRR